MFINNKYVTKRDIKSDENKIIRFSMDIGYKQRGDTKSKRSKVIRESSIKTFSPRKDFTNEETVYESDEGEEIEAIGLSERLRPWFPKVNPNSLIERLELLILETKAGHDGLYDEKLDTTKQLLSKTIICQEQLDKFVLITVNR